MLAAETDETVTVETIPVWGGPPATEESLARNLGTPTSPDRETAQRLCLNK